MTSESTVSADGTKAALFRGLADGSRLAILEALRSGPLTVGDIVTRTRLSQSNASNHLACLRECGLVLCQQEGRYVRYRLSDDRVGLILGLAEELLSGVANGVSQCHRFNPAEDS